MRAAGFWLTRLSHHDRPLELEGASGVGTPISKSWWIVGCATGRRNWIQTFDPAALAYCCLAIIRLLHTFIVRLLLYLIPLYIWHWGHFPLDGVPRNAVGLIVTLGLICGGWRCLAFRFRRVFRPLVFYIPFLCSPLLDFAQFCCMRSVFYISDHLPFLYGQSQTSFTFSCTAFASLGFLCCVSIHFHLPSEKSSSFFVYT